MKDNPDAIVVFPARSMARLEKSRERKEQNSFCLQCIRASVETGTGLRKNARDCSNMISSFLESQLPPLCSGLQIAPPCLSPQTCRYKDQRKPFVQQGISTEVPILPAPTAQRTPFCLLLSFRWDITMMYWQLLALLSRHFSRTRTFWRGFASTSRFSCW